MIKALFTLLCVCILFFLGRTIPAIKKFLGLLNSWFLKFLSFFGIKISKKEQTIDMSKEFKETYKEIKVMKLSKANIKEESSIDWFSLILLIISVLLYFFNLRAVTGNAISNWLFHIEQSLNLNFIKSEIDMNTLYTGLIFSAMSFAATKLLTRWKQTKQNRIERKQALIKARAKELMSSKELLDAAKEKDNFNYQRLKK